jgi:hypothetical protein
MKLFVFAPFLILCGGAVRTFNLYELNPRESSFDVEEKSGPSSSPRLTLQIANARSLEKMIPETHILNL